MNRYIQTTRNDLNELFIGTWILIAFWDHVHPSPHGADDTQGIPEKLLSRVCLFLPLMHDPLPLLGLFIPCLILALQCTGVRGGEDYKIMLTDSVLLQSQYTVCREI